MAAVAVGDKDGAEGRKLRGSTVTHHILPPQCATHRLCHPEELALLGHSLGIPWASLRSCSSRDLQLVSGRDAVEEGATLHPGARPSRALHSLPLPQLGCLRQLQAGLMLYQGLLQALAGISPALSSSVDLLRLDVADFATTVWQQVSLWGTGKWSHWNVARSTLGFSGDLLPPHWTTSSCCWPRVRSGL